MGVYNPNVPHILGEEWVPIRDESLFLSPVVNAVEQGHRFTLQTSRLLADGRFYLNTLPSAESIAEVLQVAVYATGTEALSGPVQEIIIPCNNGGATGNFILTGTSVAQALSDPSDGSFITLSGGSPATANVDMYFATNSYATALNGKRILRVEFLYAATSSNITALNANAWVFQVPQTAGIFYGGSSSGRITGPEAGPGRPVYQAISMGEVSPFWSTTPMATTERLPWQYAALQRFEFTAANRITFRITTNTSNAAALFLQYAALRVTYCEENRLAVSGQAFGDPSLSALFGLRRQYILGANAMPMRTTSTLALNPILTPADYTLVLSAPETGIPNVEASPYPLLNASRELYEIAPHKGVQVNLTRTPGQEFTQESTHILPQISLHTSGGPLTEVHVYGRQSEAQVYGTLTATQEILDSAAGAALTWPQVRFYARRWGQTTVPLKLDSPSAPVSGTGMSVQITPPEFDALPEILDGWKEITLQFPTPPTMGAGTTPQWRWSAAGELAGNRWEVLGATAPAISGVPGNLFNLVPTPNQLSSATYGAPTVGASINEGWIPQYAPPVTATADDETSDAVLIFAQTFPAITGLTVVGASQAVSGIGLDCGINPCCIPTAINYNSITWNPMIGAAGDAFQRIVAAGGFGTADTGQAWTVAGTATDYSVNGTAGRVLMNTLNSERRAVIDIGTPDQLVQVEVLTPVLATGATLGQGILLRYTDANNYYWIDAQVETSGAISIRLNKRVAGVLANVTSVVTNQLHSTTVNRMVEARIVGSTIQARTWLVDQPKPEFWQYTLTDTSLTTGNLAGVVFRATTGNTSGTYTGSVDNFLATPIGWGSYELQRMDPYTDWQTIMLATSPGVDSFLDYEARIGLESIYRIRAVDLYEFNGTWSSEVTITSTAPGVSGGCVADGHVLVFSSNERQDGTSNLAYASTWEGQVSEDFTFIEAGFTQLQAMYNKDFFTAFRPLERGGERFQRTVLVQAAAIDPLTLADFTSLRDMAWADTSYVCVRDEDGNRWFATVLVPAGKVRLNRTIYTAQVDIIEVTDTASPVDP